MIISRNTLNVSTLNKRFLSTPADRLWAGLVHCNTWGSCLHRACETFGQCGPFVARIGRVLRLLEPVWHVCGTRGPNRRERSASLTCRAWRRSSSTVSRGFWRLYKHSCGHVSKVKWLDDPGKLGKTRLIQKIWNNCLSVVNTKFSTKQSDSGGQTTRSRGKRARQQMELIVVAMCQNRGNEAKMQFVWLVRVLPNNQISATLN